jgi:lysophospholipase L1-like esterase
LILLFGLVTVDLESHKWLLIGLVVYALPVACQALPMPRLAVGALWVGSLMVAQTVVSRFYPEPAFRTLPPNLNRIVDVRGGLPGLDGPQEVTTDRLGFRTTKPVDYRRDDTFRVFAIGASTTAQVYLDDRRTWTHLLQERLDRAVEAEVEVINTGVSGLRAHHHLGTLERIRAYHPNLVIFLLGINDWNQDIENHFLQIESSKANAWLLKNTLAARLGRRIKHWILSRPQTRPNVRVDHREFYGHTRGSLARSARLTYRPETVSDDYARDLEAIRDACQTAGVTCVFVTQPNGYQLGASEEYKDGMWMTPPHQSYTLDFDSMVNIAKVYNDHLIAFTRANGLALCDAAPEMEASYAFFYDDCHFNRAGAERFAELMFPCVLEIARREAMGPRRR